MKKYMKFLQKHGNKLKAIAKTLGMSESLLRYYVTGGGNENDFTYRLSLAIVKRVAAMAKEWESIKNEEKAAAIEKDGESIRGQ